MRIFVMPEQIPQEIKGVAKLIDEVYQLFGFKYHVELSTRPENSMGKRRGLGDGNSEATAWCAG